MSQERLQEHFSDLYEGTIDPGLEQQIKARFGTDPGLKDDYDQFVTTMYMLGKMPEEEIEVPFHLSSMIADRLAANPKKQTISLGTFWRNLGFGALACIAIFGAFTAIKTRSDGPNEGSVISQVQRRVAPQKAQDLIEIKMVKGEPKLTFDSNGPKTVTVVNFDDQKLLKKKDVDSNKPFDATLSNANELTAVFQIEATGENAKHLVIVPGSSTELEAVGKGDLIVFAKLLATKYRTVVHLQFATEAKRDLQWDISAVDAQTAATSVLSASDYTVTMSTDGILNIQATK